MLLAMILVSTTLPNTHPQRHSEDPRSSGKESTHLERVDFLGAGLMAAMILSFLLPVEIGGVKIPWTHPLIPILFGLGVVLAILFAMTEAWWAKEPILPLMLLRQRDAVTSFLVMGCQTGAQVGVSAPPSHSRS